MKEDTVKIIIELRPLEENGEPAVGVTIRPSPDSAEEGVRKLGINKIRTFMHILSDFVDPIYKTAFEMVEVFQEAQLQNQEEQPPQPSADGDSK